MEGIGTEVAALGECAVAFDPDLEGGIVHDGLGCLAGGVLAVGLGDEDEELLREGLLEADVVAEGDHHVLDGVDDDDLRAVLALEALDEVADVFGLEDLETADTLHLMPDE